MDFLKKIPIGQYVVGDAGWIRVIDPRLKFLWVMFFLITPVLAGSFWRIGLVCLLLVITCISLLPFRIWWRSVSFLAMFSIFLGLLVMFLPTSEASIALASRSPVELPNAVAKGIQWEVLKSGPINIGNFSLGSLLIDRRSLDLGVKTSTLVFTVVHSVNLMLLTTSPENLTWTLSWFLRPLAVFRVPIDRLSFQVLLALRFIPLVQEELQNLARSLSTRAINYRKIGIKSSISIFLSLGERLLVNILLRAEQGADALLARNGGLVLQPMVFKNEDVGNIRTFCLNLISFCTLIVMFFLRNKYGQF